MNCIVFSHRNSAKDNSPSLHLLFANEIDYWGQVSAFCLHSVVGVKFHSTAKNLNLRFQEQNQEAYKERRKRIFLNARQSAH